VAGRNHPDLASSHLLRQWADVDALAHADPDTDPDVDGLADRQGNRHPRSVADRNADRPANGYPGPNPNEHAASASDGDTNATSTDANADTRPDPAQPVQIGPGAPALLYAHAFLTSRTHAEAAGALEIPGPS
jgi:hypothetical protein